MKPGRPDVDRPLETTPRKWDLPPDRERYVEEARRELEEWDERIKEVKQHANEVGDRRLLTKATQAERAWIEAKAKWDGLRTTRSENWDTMRRNYEMSHSDLREAWSDVERRL